jgi:PhnB protein
MTQINAYITFSGNCREAMSFYQQCLGGELVLQTVGESPMANQWPAHLQHGILHGSLTNKGIVLLGSDMSGPAGVTKGNNISLSLSCDTEEELTKYFANISADGTINHPLSDFFAGKIGNLTDKFGIGWTFFHAKNNAG